MFQKLTSKNWYITLTNWEYWPWYIANIPVFGMVLWFALKARRLFFFSAVNPAIETGGVWGESKIDILHAIPKQYLPVTIFIKKELDVAGTILLMQEKKLDFPVIAKPNIGERGFLVAKIKNREELTDYMQKNRVDFLLQEFIAGPVEMSILHYLPPESQQGETTSICIKNFLEVRGNGHSTVRDLMLKNPRAKLQLARFEKEFPDILENIPLKGERRLLEPIGNHCRGTTFLNGNNLINAALMTVFDKVMKEMKDIHYGRFDLRCSSVEKLRNGEFKILEFNGIAAEPAHIYDPAIPVWKKYRILFRHWKIIYDLYLQQKEKGVPSMTLGEAIRSYKKYASYKKMATQPDL